MAVKKNLSVNNSTFRSSDVVKEYDQKRKLFPAEEIVFADAVDKFPGARVLDLGVGTGRTTSYFLDRVSEYIGIDYADEMVKRAKIRFPDAKLFHLNALDIETFFHGRIFDIIIFSFNGIDYVDHASRIKILKSIKSLLAPNGIFIFSSHHLAFGLQNRGFKIPAFAMTRNPFRLTVRLLRTLGWVLKSYPRYLMRRRMEEVHQDYAFLNDLAHKFGLITYYISAEKQIEQLKSIGFDGEIAIYNPSESLPNININNETPWLMYKVF